MYSCPVDAPNIRTGALKGVCTSRSVRVVALALKLSLSRCTQSERWADAFTAQTLLRDFVYVNAEQLSGRGKLCDLLVVLEDRAVPI